MLNNEETHNVYKDCKEGSCYVDIDSLVLVLQPLIKVSVLFLCYISNC